MNHPVRILVLFGNVPLLGQELKNIDVLDSLRKSGAEVLFLIRSEWTQDTIQAELNRRKLSWTAVPFYAALRKGHGPFVWIKNAIGILGGSFQLLRWHRKFQPTHIHAPHVSSVINFLPALCIIRTPLIYRVGDDITVHHWLWRVVWRFTKWRTQMFVANSRFAVDCLKARGVPQERISLASNIAMNTKSQDIIDETISIKHDAEICTFIFIGQLTRQKGIDLFVYAAISFCKQSDKCRFIIAGDFSWKNELAISLIQEVKESGFSDRIIFVGYIRNTRALLLKCDVHVCPSVQAEVFGNVVVEAKQAGLPSIIFPMGGLPELVVNGVDGWICKENEVAELVAAFGFYENNPDVTRQQGRAAKASLPKLGDGKFDTDWQEVYEHGST